MFFYLFLHFFHFSFLFLGVEFSTKSCLDFFDMNGMTYKQSRCQNKSGEEVQRKGFLKHFCTFFFLRGRVSLNRKSEASKKITKKFIFCIYIYAKRTFW